MEKLKDIKTIAAELGLSKRKVLDLMKNNMLWHKRIGRKYYSVESKILLFINGDQPEPEPILSNFKRSVKKMGRVIIPDNI
ncbi:MAG: hypothetical protein KAH48_04165 [Chlorobi bacterium]|nr:hypothetical protein [Chlorobiota bacterium]